MDGSINRRNFLKGAGTALGTVAAASSLVESIGPRSAYAQTPGLPPAGPWGFGNQIEEIRKRGKIIIAHSTKIPPQAYRDKKTNEPAGFDIEVGKMLAKDLEVQPDFQEIESGPASLAGLMAGKYDLVIVGIANRPSRALAVQFTRGYVPYDQVMLIKASAKDVPWQEWNKKGVRISAQLGASGEFRAKEAFPNAEIIALTLPECMLEVAAGRADACLTEGYLALPFAAAHKTTKVLQDPATGKPQVVAREWGCLPVRTSEHAFMHYLDNWLAWYWERGNLQSLYDKVMGPAMRGDTYWK
jgi:polar amino acid transport system substrate-binding protein